MYLLPHHFEKLSHRKICLKASLSESTQPKPSTSQSLISSQLKQPPKKVATQVAHPQKTQSPKSPIRRDTKSPSGGLRQNHTPRPRIQLEKTNSENRFSVLEDVESECGVLLPSPTSPTPDGVGQKPLQTPKPQRTKPHK